MDKNTTYLCTMENTSDEVSANYREILRKFYKAIKASENALFNILIPRPGECAESYEPVLSRATAKLEALAGKVLMISITVAMKELKVDKKALFLAHRIVNTTNADSE